jgi:hypothetical protein
MCKNTECKKTTGDLKLKVSELENKVRRLEDEKE